MRGRGGSGINGTTQTLGLGHDKGAPQSPRHMDDNIKGRKNEEKKIFGKHISWIRAMDKLL